LGCYFFPQVSIPSNYLLTAAQLPKVVAVGRPLPFNGGMQNFDLAMLSFAYPVASV
jgi:hypothetical protein